MLFANTDWYLYNFRRSFALALEEAGYDVLMLSPPGPYGERLRALGLRWETVPMRRLSLNPFREAGLLLHLARLFRHERPALVHGFTIKCAIYAKVAARMAGIRACIAAISGLGYVFTSDDRRARWLRAPVWGLMRLTLGGRRTRLVLQNTEDVALFGRTSERLARLIRLIPSSGVDLARFRPADARAPEAPFTVLLAARLLWDKGVGEYVEAARRLRAEGRPIRFLLAGTPDGGNPSAVPHDTVRGWVEEGVVEWLGHVDDMPALFASVDAVVLPSYREGLPKSLIEAAACALPLVTSDAPGCREAVLHEETGLLVPPRDPEAIAEAVARLQDDPALAQRLGEAARRRALDEFDERIVNERTLAVYRELLG